VAGGSLVDSLGCGRERCGLGERRREVTEVTEGELGLVVKISIGDSVGVWARNQVQGESIAQRSRRSQREVWFVVKISIGDSVGVVREIKSKRKASHREETSSPGSPSNERERFASHPRRVTTLSRHRR
jgi:hypothetical protein